MSETLNVKLASLVEHDSLAAALKVSPVRQEAVREVNARVAGSVIEGAAYMGDSLTLRISGGARLVFRVEGGTVAVAVDSGSLRTSSAGLPRELRFRFAGAGTGTWPWHEMLENMTGKEIVSVAAGEEFLWLYLRGTEDIMFTALVVLDTGRHLLHFGPE